MSAGTKPERAGRKDAPAGGLFGSVPFLIAGPCVVESDEVNLRVADALAQAASKYSLRVIFKSSFDKANRATPGGARGPGIESGLAALERVRAATGLPLLTDIHEPDQAAVAARVVDVLQVPAFLCRQSDLLLAVGATGLPVNVKKGQWMDAAAMAGAIAKVRSGGSPEVAVTERGTFFGYGDLVVDMRNMLRLRQATGARVVFDATHSVQQPGQGPAGSSAGAPEFIAPLLHAAAVSGADAFFMETHPEPSCALSDGACMLPLQRLDDVLGAALELWHCARKHGHV
jgi:2-dehydro-3-deoxyphosphooctonate aldolase (KDO 8-P synthase)